LKEIAVKKVFKNNKLGKRALPLNQLIASSIQGFETLKRIFGPGQNRLDYKDIARYIQEKKTLESDSSKI